ncbi:MAG: hypothetical protein ABI760_25395 [Ferruginibacter sp.]
MNTIRIFVASSSELEKDRKEFREFLGVENDRLHTKGVYLELIQWENFLDTVSITSLQDEYNEELKKSQIVVCLFFTKAGKYTQEEFDTALQHFKEKGSPLIYTYFKSGAPETEPTDEQSLNLIAFKKRLSGIGHFYTVYNNIDDLKYQFLKQLDRLEDKGIIVLQQEVAQETKEAVTNYFNIKNAVIGSTISAGGDVHVGDNITYAGMAVGSNNIVIQGVTDSAITVNVNGHSQEISNKLDALMALLEKQGAQTFQSDDRIYNADTINKANFAFLLGRAGQDKTLPEELAQNLVGDGNNWTQSLRQELVKQGLSVGNQPWNIFQNYGWLVETFLQKMGTAAGQEKNLRRLSFMAEAYQGSLRYLCYIQMAQVLQLENKPKPGIVSDFIQMEGSGYLSFDYSSLLLTTTDILGENGFMQEINKFADELTDTESALYGTALYLEDQRRKLMANTIAEDDKLPGLLDEYLTALVYWLRKLTFLAKYRLVSIKEINLNYRLGTAKNFVHLYGELHGIYSEGGTSDEDYNSKSIEGSFTYNKSILLFKGNDVASCMDKIQDQTSYLSLSPLVIDQSVYAGKPTQTPEIFYYSGYEKPKRRYGFAQYKNELAYGGKGDIVSNKMLGVLTQNNNQPRLDELFEQLEEVFKPLKNKTV